MTPTGLSDCYHPLVRSIPVVVCVVVCCAIITTVGRGVGLLLGSLPSPGQRLPARTQPLTRLAHRFFRTSTPVRQLRRRNLTPAREVASRRCRRAVGEIDGPRRGRDHLAPQTTPTRSPSQATFVPASAALPTARCVGCSGLRTSCRLRASRRVRSIRQPRRNPSAIS